MNSDQAVTAVFELIPPTCYALTVSHTGNGSTPLADPLNSTGCAANKYVEGATISLNDATADPGWEIAGWSGTADDTSKETTNSVTMPAMDHAASVNYTEIPTIIELISPEGDQTDWGNTFSWTGIPAADYYQIEVSKISGEVILSQWYTKAYVCSGLDCHVSPAETLLLESGGYRWRIQDCSANGYGPWTGYMAFTLLPQPNVVLISPEGDQTDWGNTFSWTGIPGADYYQIEVSKTSGEVILSEWYTKAYVCSGLDCHVSPAETLLLESGGYRWRIQDYSASGYGPWTSSMAFTLLPQTNEVLISPEGDQTDWGNTFSWTGIPAADYYQIEVSKISGEVILSQWYTKAYVCSGLDCHVSPAETLLLESGGYRWRIQDYSASGYGPWTGYMAFTLLPQTNEVLISPEGDQTDWGNTFSWTGIPAADYYQIEVSKISGEVILSQWYTKAYVCSGLDCHVSPAETLLLESGGYRWRIQDYSASGYGPWTSSMAFTLLPQTNEVLISPEGDQTDWGNTFSWTGIPAADYYQIEVSKISGEVILSQWYTKAYVCSGLDCHVSPAETLLLESGGYRWRIQDYSASGYGPWTSYMAFTLLPQTNEVLISPEGESNRLGQHLQLDRYSGCGLLPN